MSHGSRLAFALTVAAVAALICSTASASLLDVKVTDVFDGTTHFGPGTYDGTPAANHGVSADGKLVNLLQGDTVTFTVYAEMSSLFPSGNTTGGLQTTFLSFRTAGYDVSGTANNLEGADRFGVTDMTGLNGTVYPATSALNPPGSVISYVGAAKDPTNPMESMGLQTTVDLAGAGWASIAAAVGAPLAIAGDEDVHMAQGGPISTTAHPGAFMTSAPLMSLTYNAGQSGTAGSAPRRTWFNILAGSAFPDFQNQISSGIQLLQASGGTGGQLMGLTGGDIGGPVIVGVNVPPVPEPGTIALLLAGAVTLVLARRRLWG